MIPIILVLGLIVTLIIIGAIGLSAEPGVFDEPVFADPNGLLRTLANFIKQLFLGRNAFGILLSAIIIILGMPAFILVLLMQIFIWILIAVVDVWKLGEAKTERRK